MVPSSESNISLDVAVKVTFWMRLIFKINSLWVKQIILQRVGGPCLTSWRPWEKRWLWSPVKKEFCLHISFEWGCNINSSLDLQPADFRLACPQNYMSQLSLSMYLSFYVHVCSSIYISYWVCFSGEPWLIQSCNRELFEAFQHHRELFSAWVDLH